LGIARSRASAGTEEAALPFDEGFTATSSMHNVSIEGSDGIGIRHCGRGNSEKGEDSKELHD
jgi:hypothetical protein